MTDVSPDSALAIGTLIGNMQGMMKAIDEQNKTAAASKIEFLDVLKGIREDNKEVVTELRDHVKADAIIHTVVTEVQTWKQEVAPKIDTLWDSKNKVLGMVIGVGSIGGLAGAAITLAVQAFKH